MNTPKEIKRDGNAKRIREALKKYRLPAGSYSHGCTNKEVLLALADAVSYWPFVEDAMAHVLRALIGTPPEEISSSIFHTLVTQASRKAVMKALLEDTAKNKNKDSYYDDVIDKFDKLNAQRNNYVHMFWYTQQETGIVYLCPSKRGSYHALHFGRAVDVTELKKFRDACDELVTFIFHNIWEVESPRNKKPQKQDRK